MDKTRRDKIVLASKVYNGMIRDKEVINDGRGISKYKVKKHLEDSLARLQTDHLDLYQVHHIDRDITADEFFEIFEPPKSEGKILYLGTSNYPGWKLGRASNRGQIQRFYGNSIRTVAVQPLKPGTRA